MNTKKHGIGHTQHREGDFKFFYVHSLKLNHSSAILSDVRGALLLKKNACFECQPIRIKSMYVDVLSDWTTITKAV